LHRGDVKESSKADPSSTFPVAFLVAWLLVALS
jgi:hypothetical protein